MRGEYSNHSSQYLHAFVYSRFGFVPPVCLSYRWEPSTKGGRLLFQVPGLFVGCSQLSLCLGCAWIVLVRIRPVYRDATWGHRISCYDRYRVSLARWGVLRWFDHRRDGSSSSGSSNSGDGPEGFLPCEATTLGLSSRQSQTSDASCY